MYLWLPCGYAVRGNSSVSASVSVSASASVSASVFVLGSASFWISAGISANSSVFTVSETEEIILEGYLDASITSPMELISEM